MSEIDVTLIEKGIKFLAIALIGVILSIITSSPDIFTSLILISIAISLFAISYFYSKRVIKRGVEKE